jgi:hypothetical protein
MEKDPEASARSILGMGFPPASKPTAEAEEPELDVEGTALDAATDEAFTALKSDDRAAFKAALRSALEALISEA